MGGSDRFAPGSAEEIDYTQALERLRRICSELPQVVEGRTWGNPTFSVGRKAVAVLDRYKGVSCICFLCPAELREELLSGDGFFETPYDKKKTSLCVDIKALSPDRMQELVRLSFEQAVGD